MNRATVLIVSDEREFPNTIAASWVAEGDTPAFVCRSGAELVRENFDLAIAGSLLESPDSFLSSLQRSGRPVIHVSHPNGGALRRAGVITLPELPGWSDLVVVVAKQILQRAQAASEVTRLSELTFQLERQAALGRYMLEMRHNLNNALTSILGNSDLILLDGKTLPEDVKEQLETIRNMGMRVNEIMQRFTSLQKEMQLVEQQSKAGAKAAMAGI